MEAAANTENMKPVPCLHGHLVDSFVQKKQNVQF